MHVYISMYVIFVVVHLQVHTFKVSISNGKEWHLLLLLKLKVLCCKFY